MTVRTAWNIFKVATVVFTASVVLAWQDPSVPVMRWITGIYLIITLNALLHERLEKRKTRRQLADVTAWSQRQHPQPAAVGRPRHYPARVRA